MTGTTGREPALPSEDLLTGNEPELGGGRSLRPPEGALVLVCPMCHLKFGAVLNWDTVSRMACPVCRYTFPVQPMPEQGRLIYFDSRFPGRA